MRKHSKKKSSRASGGFERLPTSSSNEFYSTSPNEKPLDDRSGISDSKRVRGTHRHQLVGGRPVEKIDPREKVALAAILKSFIMVLLLVITLFMLRQGIKLYEDSIWLDHKGDPEKSPVLQEIVMTGDFDIQNKDSREQFAHRIELWKEADRLVRSADVLLHRNIYDQAIEQCQDALRKDPSHRGALERLGRLYYSKKDYVEAANAYIRLLSVDPSEKAVQKRLIASLDALGDHKAVIFMTEWYLSENLFDVDIQRYQAHSFYAQENLEEAVIAYDRVLLEVPSDLLVLERQAIACMQTQQYEKALVSFTKLSEKNYRNPVYYKQIVLCNAKLDYAREAVLALGRAVELFGESLVMGWIQDPQLDPIRQDRSFQAFTDRIGGKAFRFQLEKMAGDIEEKEKESENMEPKLAIPSSEFKDNDLLKKNEE